MRYEHQLPTDEEIAAQRDAGLLICQCTDPPSPWPWGECPTCRRLRVEVPA